MTAVVDLGALAADATTRLAELEEQRLRLSPEALSDSEVAAELADIESAIVSCRQVLERVRLARVETERREHQAETDVRERARQECLAHARRLEGERRKAAAAVDKAAAVFATQLRAFDRITTEQEVQLRRAGERQAADIARPRSWMFELALAHALRAAGLPRGALRVEALIGAEHVALSQIRPLAELDPRPIEPEATGSNGKVQRNERER